ncbi:hypothetical protein V6N11_035227 [Hibiscus sabdariffa]|uniref:Uncharacterized protein n=1 Tax=Hibiscus sabdariffa TaxID=183260 RepID=A0ABR2QZM5_9ROSI
MGNDTSKQGQISQTESSLEGADMSTLTFGEDDFLGSGCIGNNQTLAANHVSKSGEGQLGMDQMDVNLEKCIEAGLSWAETETKRPEVGVGSTALEPINGVGSKGPVFSDPNGIKVVNVSLGDSDIAMPRAFGDVKDMGLFPNLMEIVVNSANGIVFQVMVAVDWVVSFGC